MDFGVPGTRFLVWKLPEGLTRFLGWRLVFRTICSDVAWQKVFSVLSFDRNTGTNSGKYLCLNQGHTKHFFGFSPKKIRLPRKYPGISGNRSQKSELPNLIKFTTERFFNFDPFLVWKMPLPATLFQAARATAYSHKSEMEELGFNKHDFVNLWYFAMTLVFWNWVGICIRSSWLNNDF